MCLAQRTDLEPLNRHIAATGVAANAPGRRCTRPGDGFEDFGEQLSGVGLVVVGGVIVLTAEDGEELRAGLEEAAAFADGLEVAAVGGAWVVEARITPSRLLGGGPRRAGTVWEDG